MKFLLSSQLAEFLLSFEKAQSTERLAADLRCSPSVVFRNLQAIADIGPLVSKINGRWCLAPLGRRMNAVNRRTIWRQRQLLNRPYAPVVGYSPALLSGLCIALVHRMLLDQKYQAGGFLACDPLKAEERVACGEIDFVITDRIPSSPAFRYHVLRTFTHLPVIASGKMTSLSRREDEIAATPFIGCKYQEVPPGLLSFCSASQSRFEVEGIGTCLEYVGIGLGWSLIPSYLLTSALTSRTVTSMFDQYRPEERRLLVFWLRGKEIPPDVVKTLDGLFQPAGKLLANPTPIASTVGWGA